MDVKAAFAVVKGQSLGVKRPFASWMAGLPAGPITSVLEDQQGDLWISGGDRGLCRYDPRRTVGQSFTCLTTRDGLVNNDVWSILEDRTGQLLVGTRNEGLSRYDGKRFMAFTE